MPAGSVARSSPAVSLTICERSVGLRAVLPAAEAQDALDEVAPAHRRAEHFVHVGDGVAQPGVLRALPRELGEADDRSEDVVEVVGHAAGEGPHRLQLLGLAQLLLEAPLRLLGAPAFADIDDGADDEQAFGRRDRREPDLDGELRPVLAPAVQFAPGPHDADLRVAEERGA
jgi:hypothetical protein